MSSLSVSMAGHRDEINLGGRWQLAFDPLDEGFARGWMCGHWPEAASDWTIVPGLWNLTHPDVEGIGFYRTVFRLPESWSGRGIRVCFGGSSYRTDAWLNGEFLGTHEGAYTPFAFPLGRWARLGESNELVVRVAALSRTRAVDGLNLEECPASKQSWYYSYGGLWGNVVLEATNRLWIRDLAIEPNLANETVQVSVQLENWNEYWRSAEIALEIHTASGDCVARQDLPAAAGPGVTRLDLGVELPNPHPWSLDDPHLYQAQVVLREEGQATDSLSAMFGMRDFTIQDGRFYLNGELVFMRGVLLQPNYPVELIRPTTHEMMEREIALVKEAGYNLIRAHIQPSLPEYLDLTDRYGLLVYAESDLAWIKPSPRLLDHGRRELKAMVEYERNHPSVVIWGIHNENRAASHASGEVLSRYVRALDPTRVIVENSGGTLAIDQDYGWADVTRVIANRETQPQITQDLHIYTGAPVTNAVYDWLHSLGTDPPMVDMAAEGFGSEAVMRTFHDQLRSYRGDILVSELGCGGMCDLDAVVEAYSGREHLQDAREAKAFRDSLYQGFHERRLDKVFGLVKNLVEAAQEQQAQGNIRQIEALMTNPRISGTCLTQLNDVSWEFHAGVLDPWRNPKRAYQALKRLNQPYCLILRAESQVVPCGTPIVVSVVLVAERPLTGSEVLTVRRAGPDGDVTETRVALLPAGRGISQLEPVVIARPDLEGVYRVQVSLHGPEGLLSETSEEVLVLVSDRAPEVQIGPVGVDATGRSIAPAVLLAARPETLQPAEWVTFLDQVAEGRVGLVGPLKPSDTAAVRALTDRGLPIRLHFGFGNWMGTYHWVPDSPVFEGLPAGRLAGEAYADVLPRYVLSELGGEVLAGSLNNTQTRLAPSSILWYSDIELIRFGRGRLCLCQYRCFERASSNPLAARLRANLVGHLAALAPEA